MFLVYYTTPNSNNLVQVRVDNGMEKSLKEMK